MNLENYFFRKILIADLIIDMLTSCYHIPKCIVLKEVEMGCFLALKREAQPPEDTTNNPAFY